MTIKNTKDYWIVFSILLFILIVEMRYISQSYAAIPVVGLVTSAIKVRFVDFLLSLSDFILHVIYWASMYVIAAAIKYFFWLVFAIVSAVWGLALSILEVLGVQEKLQAAVAMLDPQVVYFLNELRAFESLNLLLSAALTVILLKLIPFSPFK